MPILPILGAISGIASLFGKQQGGDADARIKQAGVQQNQDRNAIDLYQAQQDAQNRAAQLDLQRKSYDTTHRSSAGKEALIAMLLGNHTPSNVSVQGIPQASVTGGMGTALKTPQILELLKAIAAKGQTDQASPVGFSGGDLMRAPTLTPLPQAGKGSGLLNTIARIAQFAGPVGSLVTAFKQPGE